MTDSGDSLDPRRGASRAPVLGYRFITLLAGLFLLMAAAPLVRLLEHPTLAGVAMTFFFGLMLLAAVLAVSTRRRNTVVALVLAVPAVLLPCIYLAYPGRTLALAKDGIGCLAIAYIVLLLLGHLFRTRRVTFDTIAASLCIYLLLGLLWALAYSVLVTIDPDAFHYAYAEEVRPIRFGGDRSDLAIYFSFVTMTTLGYGDVVPLSGPARMLAALQAIIGQIYLTVLVARLVGLHIAHASEKGDLAAR